MMDQLQTRALPKKKMSGEKFLKDSPSKIWAGDPKYQKIIENFFFEFEKYAIPIFLMTATKGTILSNATLFFNFH